MSSVKRFWVAAAAMLLAIPTLPALSGAQATRRVSGIVTVQGSSEPVPGATIQVVEVPPGPPVLQTLVAEVYGPDADRRLEQVVVLPAR